MSNRRDDNSPDEAEQREYNRRAKEHTIAGTAFGVASAGAFAAFGTLACPLCAVAAPLLIGSGAYNAHKANQCEGDELPDNGPCVGERIQFSS